MAITRADTERLLLRPGVPEALSDWEKKRRPGQLIQHAERSGASLSDAEADALEFQSVLRQASDLSSRAVRLRR
jgi:hypothetical protein